VPLPRTEDLAAFYPPVYTFGLDVARVGGVKKVLSQIEYAAFYRPQYRSQVRRVIRGCGWKRGNGRMLLDIGCGRGLRLLEFRRHGFEVHGLDLVPDNVRYLREDLNIPAECADITEITRVHQSQSFDLVTAFFVLEHIPDVRGAVAGMFELLKPGGWLAAAVPLIDALQARVLGKWWSSVTEAPRHLTLPTQQGVAGVFRDAGFEAVAVRPDAALSCAAQLSLSLFPGAAMTHTYGRGTVWPLVNRLACAAATFGLIPWALFESHVMGFPANGIVFGRKPGPEG
jgi:SAM-dependent methyltransferase